MNTVLPLGVARVAGTIGHPVRDAMLSALLGGQWMTAGELARRGGVAPSTASAHLAQLVDAGLVARRTSGRHRYFALAGEEVAAALEALARIPAPEARTPVAVPEDQRALRFARTCYDHLAGTLGVLLADTLVQREIIAPTGAELGARGAEWLRGLGIDADVLAKSRRTLARFCLDWSERRDHLAGAVGAAITGAMLERGWLARIAGTRAVRLTLRGREGLYRALELRVDSLD